MDSKGGTATLALTTQAECAWTAAAQASWISGVSPASGQGNAQIQFQVSTNPDPTSRQGDIVFNDQHVQIRQNGTPCAYQVTPETQSIGPDAVTGTLNVTAAAPCAWTATAGASWLSITSGASGSGNGTVTYRAQANGGAVRGGAITVAGQTVTITQGSVSSPAPPAPPGGPPGCEFAIDASLRSIGTSGGPLTVDVTAGAGCAWTAESQITWVNVTGGASGTGNGRVNLTVDPNGGSSRIGPVRIAGLIFLVDQAGNCAIAIAPTSQSFATSGGAGSPITVTTNAGCAWTATSNAPWIAITNGASGSGNGAVSFAIAANPGAARTGTIGISGQAFTISQAANCTATINPTSQSIAAGGGAGNQVGVTIAAGCAWTATSNASWLTIANGASGNGNGTVTFTAAANAGAARSGTLTIAGQTFTANQAAVQAPNCAATINPTSQSVAAAGGAGASIAVTIAAGCAWNATSNAPWLTITNGASGNGNGTVTFTAAANSGAARSGTLTIAGETFTANQAGNCTATLNPTSQSIPVGGNSGNQVAVTIPGGCAWTATSNAAWLTITNGANGNGNGTVTFSAAANAGAARSGTLTIAGQTFTANQDGNCAATLNPTSQSVPVGGGAGNQVAVAIPAGCAWTATSNAPWLTITNGASGNGNGTVTFTAAANSGSARSGTLTIAAQTFTANQAANCAATLNPTSQSIPVGGGAGNQVAVTIAAGCAWTATSNAPWLTITNGASGNGNGTVTFTAAANSGGARSGTLTIASQTFTANQAANCASSINPTSQAVGQGGRTDTVAVTVAAGCAWTAASNASWITITAGANGNGNGSVAYTVAANMGADRSGTMTIAGLTFTANQSGPCNPSLTPTSDTFNRNAGNGTVDVHNGGSCAWTAVSQVSWIQITSGSPDTGNGQVRYHVDAFQGPGSSRTGTIIIAGITFTVTQSSQEP